MQPILTTHPAPSPIDPHVLAQAVAAALECAQACTACADACLSEDMVADLRTCIVSDLDCADVCDTTARILSRQTGGDRGYLRSQVEACLAVCESCGAECARHAGMHEHCRLCAEACRRCADACRALLGALG